MRALAHQATTNRDAILLLDFANAFNSADRNLMISLSARMYPELTNLTWWLYHIEPRVLTSTGDVARSSSGTQRMPTIKPPFRSPYATRTRDDGHPRFPKHCNFLGRHSPNRNALRSHDYKRLRTRNRPTAKMEKSRLYGIPSSINVCQAFTNPTPVSPNKSRFTRTLISSTFRPPSDPTNSLPTGCK